MGGRGRGAGGFRRDLLFPQPSRAIRSRAIRSRAIRSRAIRSRAIRRVLHKTKRMIFLGFLGYVVLAVLIGYAVISASYGRRAFRLAEMAGLSIAMGLGVVALLLFYCSLAGFVPSRRLLGVFGIVAVVA